MWTRSANRMVTAPPEVIVVGSRLNKAMSRSALLAEQHTDPFVAYSELLYAKAFLKALQELMTDGEIKTSFKVDIRRMLHDLDKIERRKIERMRQIAPNLIPSKSIAVGHIP